MLHLETTALGDALRKLKPGKKKAVRDKLDAAANDLDQTASALGVIGLEGRDAFIEARKLYEEVSEKKWVEPTVNYDRRN